MNDVSICYDKQFNKNFRFGSGVTPIGGKRCQLLLAQACAANTSNGCLNLQFDDNYLPGFDLFSRNISQTQQDAYVRNVALRKYTFATSGNCERKVEAILGTIASSPRITYYHGPKCQPFLTLTPDQIKDVNSGRDQVLIKLLKDRPKFNDILSSIKTNMIKTKTWDKISEDHRW